MKNNNKIQQARQILTGFFFACCLLLLLSLSGCAGTRVDLSAGEGEVGNEYQHRHTEVNVAAPIMEIIIPITPGKPDNPVIVIEGLGKAVQTVTSGQTDARMNLREVFAGVGIRGEHGSVGLVADDTYFVLTAEGYGQLTNLLRFRGGITHRNAHQGIPHAERFKSTQAHVGVDMELGRGLTAGVSYHTGNVRRALVHDSFRLNLGYEF